MKIYENYFKRGFLEYVPDFLDLSIPAETCLIFNQKQLKHMTLRVIKKVISQNRY